MEDGWATVFVTEEEYQAIIAKDILENNGIKAVIMNQRDSAYMVFGQISVLVSEDDKEWATNLLNELKH